MKERLFYLWRVINRITIIYLVSVYFYNFVTGVNEYGLKAYFIFNGPIAKFEDYSRGDFELPIVLCLFITSWLIGWISTGRHAWNVGSYS